ncbi:MAG TPA: dTDP-4-dehydrorhamnose reductase [Candidatus Krumholzibacteria bacterium]|nr:dTDP-4-dehydrorhamnose reductase [Candidatus Krumholzibacteria bacterium]
MRILITGAAGMLGRAVVAACADQDAVGVDLPDGDLTRPDDVDALLRVHRPAWVIHCAAYTDVDGAETARDIAWRANAEATALLADRCGALEIGLSAVSTDYVFAGDAADGYHEDAPRAPLSHYGATKAAAELAVEAMGGRGQIVRTSWLFGPGPKNFVRTIRRLLRERDELRVVEDQRGCPTYAPDLARVLAYLAMDGTPGRYHATNAGVCTWFEFAREIAAREGHDPAKVRPCTSAEYPTPARRPACSVLHSRALEARGCPPRPDWRDALDRYLELLRREDAAEEER